MSVDQFSSIPLEVKNLSDTGEFTGIASVSGNVDLGADIMQPGAFTKTIAERGNKVRLMDNHKIRIGVATVSEEPGGLATTGKINLEKQAGREAFSDLKFYRDHGLPMGMSIGYQAIKFDYNTKGHRLLHEVKLYEVTVTELPMNERAQVLTVKSISNLITKAKYSRQVKDDFAAELAENELECAGGLMMSALQSALGSLLWEGDMTREERIAAASNYIAQFSEAFTAYLPAYLDYLAEEYGSYKSQAAIDLKAGRAISAANRNALQTAHDHMKSAQNLIYPLLEDEADAAPVPDAGITSKSIEAGPDEKPAPVIDHSAFASVLDAFQARFTL